MMRNSSLWNVQFQYDGGWAWARTDSPFYTIKHKYFSRFTIKSNKERTKHILGMRKKLFFMHGLLIQFIVHFQETCKTVLFIDSEMVLRVGNLFRIWNLWLPTFKYFGRYIFSCLFSEPKLDHIIFISIKSNTQTHLTFFSLQIIWWIELRWLVPFWL